MELLGNPYVYVGITAFVALGFIWVSKFTFHLQAAARSLKRLRLEYWGTELKYPPSEYDLLIHHLNRGREWNSKEETKTRIAPEWIGSSEEELKDMRQRVYRYDAEILLKAFRSGECFVDAGVFRRELEQVGLSLADIGTDEAELTVLMRKQRVNAARGCLAEFRTTGNPFLLLLTMAECAENGISYEEVGTTLEKILEDMARVEHLLLLTETEKA